MTNFQQSGINFTIDNNFQTGEKNHTIKGKLVSVANDYTGYEQDDASKLINAVEIDWNDAQWPKTTPSEPTTIKTTGDLISAIKYASTVGYEADKSNNKNNE